jgi:hypothetical protein
MAAKKKQAKAKNPHHKPLVGVKAEDFGAISTIHRALLSRGKKAAAAVKKGAVDINAILALAQQLPALLAMLQGLFAMFKKPAPVPVVTPTPTPDPLPVPEPPIVPPVYDRVIATLASHWIGAEGWNGKPNGHFPVNATGIFNGSELAGAGYRLHGDSTPRDQNGQPFYNEDVGKFPALFAKDPSLVHRDATGKWTCGEGNNRTSFDIRVDGKQYGPQGDEAPGTPFDAQEVIDLTSETDDASFTPVWTVPQDLDLNSEHSFQWRQTYVAPDGRTVVGNWSTPVRIHAWGF